MIDTTGSRTHNLAALTLRVSFGATMLISHGWGKLLSYPERMNSFPDPLGIGSQLSMAATVFAEAFCAAALVLGILTRWAALPLITTMVVAAFIVHADDPWARRELAVLYLSGFTSIALLGGGSYTIVHLIRRRS